MTPSSKTTNFTNVLLDKRIILPEQYERAVEYQRLHATSIDQALVDLEILSEADLAAIYADVLQVRELKLEDVEIDREAVRHVPAAVAHRYHLIPVRRSGNSLAVAMSDPTSHDALNAVRSVTDFDIIPFVSRYDAIEHAIYLHYGEPADGDADGAEGASEIASRPRALLDDDQTGHVGRSIQLHHNQTFDTYLKDAANEFPLSVARAIADLNAEDTYNPFHCWGPAGCGKSHLLHAVASHVTAHWPLKRCILTTGQRFVDDLFQSLRDKKINFFRYLFRESDLLILDEAQALLTRDWAQRELVETFRHLQRNGKRLMLAAPGNLAVEPRILPELRIVLESGVIAGFGTYTKQTKLAIARARSGGVQLPEPVLDRLVELCGNNMMELLDVLQQLSVMLMLGSGDLTPNVVDDVVQLFGRTSNSQIAERARNLAASVKPAAPDDLKPLGTWDAAEPGV